MQNSIQKYKAGRNSSDLSLLPVQPPHQGRQHRASSCPYRCLADRGPLPEPRPGVWGSLVCDQALGLCGANAARVLCQPRPPFCTHHGEENQVSLPASDVGMSGEPLKVPALARHNSNHLRELSDKEHGTDKLPPILE